MERETKEKLFVVGAVCVYACVPWSASMMVLGAGIYYVRRIFVPDTTGDDFLHLVLGAPVSLPVLPFLFLKEKLSARQLEKKQQRSQEAAAWMISELRRRGIQADDRGSGRPIMLDVEVASEQISAYQDVVAEAVQRFSDLTQQDLYGSALTRAPLDQAWAKQHGLALYAAEVFADPCVDCGTRDPCGYHFIDASSSDGALERSEYRMEYRYRDGTVRTLSGQLCLACQGLYGGVVARSCVYSV